MSQLGFFYPTDTVWDIQVLCIVQKGYPMKFQIYGKIFFNCLECRFPQECLTCC